MADYYTTQRLIDTCRRIMDDKIEPYFVDDGLRVAGQLKGTMMKSNFRLRRR